MKRKQGIGLGIGLLAVLATVAGILLPQISFAPKEEKTPEPEELLAEYFSHIGSGQYEEMYKMLTIQSREEISLEDFISRNKGIYDGIKATDLRVTPEPPLKESGDSGKEKPASRIVEYALELNTAAGPVSYFNQASFLMEEDGEYRMQWSSRTIFPNLGPEDKVRVKTLTGERGRIFDRNGEMLAGPGVASAVGLVPGKMARKEMGADTGENAGADTGENAGADTGENSGADTGADTGQEETAKTEYSMEDIGKVAQLLEITPESILEKLNASYVRDDTFVLLRTVPKAAGELKEELLTVKGILISDTPVRFYPLGEKASHLVGYVQGINGEELEALKDKGYDKTSVLGKSGLEKIFEDQLRGEDGCEIRIVDGEGNVKQSLAKRDQVNGEDIKITVDAQIQSRLYDQFAQDKSCSVAMNPKTGEVLALVSTPSYDANDFVLGMSLSKWNKLNEDEKKPMLNRFKAAQCPGSTMKAVTAAVGLNTGILRPEDDFGHSGLRWKKDGSWGGYYVTTTKEYMEPANVENALVYSDNIYFAKAALKIGTETFAQELKEIGFEEKIPFEYGLYSSVISSTETFTSEIQLADSGFGQGQILANPVHLAVIYASFVNQGGILKPRLLYGGDSRPEFWKEQAFSPETANLMKEDLIQVIERGTGRDAKIPGQVLAGKTGTAEIKQSKEDQTGTELGWFALMTGDEAAENPLLVISMVEDVKNRGGSHYLIPKVKEIFLQK